MGSWLSSLDTKHPYTMNMIFIFKQTIGNVWGCAQSKSCRISNYDSDLKWHATCPRKHIYWGWILYKWAQLHWGPSLSYFRHPMPMVDMNAQDIILGPKGPVALTCNSRYHVYFTCMSSKSYGVSLFIMTALPKRHCSFLCELKDVFSPIIYLFYPWEKPEYFCCCSASPIYV